MTRLGRVSKETRGPSVPAMVEDIFLQNDGNTWPKR